MKFQAMCSSGLGSSFLVEMNIKQALENIGLTDFEVSHSDIGGATKNDADAVSYTHLTLPTIYSV